MNNKFLIKCSCGRATSRTYARSHDGKCKACADPENFVERESTPRRHHRYSGVCYSEDQLNSMSYSEIASCDRLDYASEVAKYDPDRAAEIRMGA